MKWFPQLYVNFEKMEIIPGKNSKQQVWYCRRRCAYRQLFNHQPLQSNSCTVFHKYLNADKYLKSIKTCKQQAFWWDTTIQADMIRTERSRTRMTKDATILFYGKTLIKKTIIHLFQWELIISQPEILLRA